MKLSCPNCYTVLTIEGSNGHNSLLDWESKNALFTDLGKCKLLHFNVEGGRDHEVSHSEFMCSVCMGSFKVKQESYEEPEILKKAA